jgi:hypothetical protein
VIDIADQVTLSGTKTFIATQITRPADRNTLKLREYDPAVYTYTAGTLPADATNVYSPDYSYTLPAAPTGLAVVSQGTAVDPDGKIVAYALIRATPPAVNWSRIMVQARDTSTNEVYQAQLILNAGNYEAVVSGLRPGRGHDVRAWAVNANNIDGATTAAVGFTSANSANAPAAATLSAQQNSPRQVFLTWTAAAPAPVRRPCSSTTSSARWAPAASPTTAARRRSTSSTTTWRSGPPTSTRSRRSTAAGTWVRIRIRRASRRRR